MCYSYVWRIICYQLQVPEAKLRLRGRRVTDASRFKMIKYEWKIVFTVRFKVHWELFNFTWENTSLSWCKGVKSVKMLLEYAKLWRDQHFVTTWSLRLFEYLNIKEKKNVYWWNCVELCNIDWIDFDYIKRVHAKVFK